jgi:DNA-binding transcriptional regulator GbsR (MarR family)
MMAKPFEGIFGDGSELRVIQFMLPSKGLEFNISELARGTGVTRQTLVHVVRKLVYWNVLMIASKHGNANYYALNEDSGFVEAFERLNNCIIEQMLGVEELAKIADYSMKHAHVTNDAPNPSHPSYIVAECGETSQQG